MSATKTLKSKQYLENLQKNIKSRNETFDAMTPAQRRVAVAKDVLEQVEVGVIIPEGGVYARIEKSNNLDYWAGLQQFVPLGADLQKVLLQDIEMESCTCCGKGAFFIAKVLGYNHTNVGLVISDNVYSHEFGEECTVNALQGVFTQRQLNLIENAFETSVLNVGVRKRYKYDWNEYTILSAEPVFIRATCMYSELSNPKERLIAICNNIIENNGEFKVPHRLKGEALEAYKRATY